MAKPEPYFVGIDIGSSKVGVLIGQRDDKGGIEVVGKGLAPNRGTRKGNIVNVEATVEALKQASEEAEVMAGVEISRAYVGVSGPDIRSVNSRGMVSVARKDREITRQDIQRVLEAAQSAALPSDREILHAVPQEFIVDEQGGIDDPLGMLGTRMEVMVHLVTGNITRSRTLLTCVNRAGIEVVEMVFEPLATAEAVLSPDERELGVLLVDIGAGTTEYALFAEGEIQYSAVAPIGAGHFTNDLAMVLRTPFAEAERIKIKQGCCLPSMVTEEEGIAVPTVAGGDLAGGAEARALRDPAAARRGAVQPDPGGPAQARHRRGAARRCRPHRRRRAARRPARALRADLRRRRALRSAARAGRAGRRDQQPDLVDGFGASPLRAGRRGDPGEAPAEEVGVQRARA